MTFILKPHDIPDDIADNGVFFTEMVEQHSIQKLVEPIVYRFAVP